MVFGFAVAFGFGELPYIVAVFEGYFWICVFE
jgi:hypothetical protein